MSLCSVSLGPLAFLAKFTQFSELVCQSLTSDCELRRGEMIGVRRALVSGLAPRASQGPIALVRCFGKRHLVHFAIAALAANDTVPPAIAAHHVRQLADRTASSLLP